MGDHPNEKFRFRVSDVIHPRPTQVLMELFRHLILEGVVLAETTDGQTKFKVVQVSGIDEPLIVPMNPTPTSELQPVTVG